jgi:hypothetical protein
MGGVQVLSYDLLKDLTQDSKLKKIMDVVKGGEVVLLEGRLTADEETVLISQALKNVSGKFSGIEIAFLDSSDSKSVFNKIKTHVLRLLAGNRIGLTVVGPSKIIKEIKMNPDKLEILFK